MKLSNKQASALRQHSHALKPVVIIGQNGLTENVMTEIEGALSHHELIKVKVNAGDHDERDAMIDKITNQMGAGVVQRIGNVVALYRENSDKRRYAAGIPSS